MQNYTTACNSNYNIFNQDSDYDNVSMYFSRQYSVSEDQPIFHRTECDTDSLQQESRHKQQTYKIKNGIFQVQNEIKQVNSQSQERKLSEALSQNFPQNFQQQQYRLTREQDEKVKKTKPDYKKNICGYITKKVIKLAIDQKSYITQITRLCNIYGVQVEYYLEYCRNIVNKITGPTHLYMLTSIDYETILMLPFKQMMKQIKLKSICRDFLIWFLRHRYLRYIMAEGKMKQKEVYVKYKNFQLLTMIRQQQIQSDLIKKRMLRQNRELQKKFQRQELQRKQLQSYIFLSQIVKLKGGQKQFDKKTHLEIIQEEKEIKQYK